MALRREVGARRRVYETRSVLQCWEMLAGSPGSFVLVELTAGNLEPLLQRMARLERDFPLARVALVADHKRTPYQWLLREAGAVDFVTSPRRLGPLAALACRHLSTSPRPPRSVTDRIWEELPWKAVGRIV